VSSIKLVEKFHENLAGNETILTRPTPIAVGTRKVFRGRHLLTMLLVLTAFEVCSKWDPALASVAGGREAGTGWCRADLG